MCVSNEGGSREDGASSDSSKWLLIKYSCWHTADIHHPGCEVIKSDSRKWDGDENHDQVQKPLGPEAWEIPVHLPTFEKRNSTFWGLLSQ